MYVNTHIPTHNQNRKWHGMVSGQPDHSDKALLMPTHSNAAPGLKTFPKETIFTCTGI